MVVQANYWKMILTSGHTGTYLSTSLRLAPLTRSFNPTPLSLIFDTLTHSFRSNSLSLSFWHLYTLNNASLTYTHSYTLCISTSLSLFQSLTLCRYCTHLGIALYFSAHTLSGQKPFLDLKSVARIRSWARDHLCQNYCWANLRKKSFWRSRFRETARLTLKCRPTTSPRRTTSKSRPNRRAFVPNQSRRGSRQRGTRQARGGLEPGSPSPAATAETRTATRWASIDVVLPTQRNEIEWSWWTRPSNVSATLCRKCLKILFW